MSDIEALRERCAEILEWHKTGILSGEAVRSLGRELRAKHGSSFSPSEALSHAEQNTAKEAMQFVVANTHLLSELDRLRSSNEAMRKALETADAAIVYYIRYLDGGEMRGSYDGKPERDALRRASYATRAALSSLKEEDAR